MNIRFSSLRLLVKSLGFSERIRGDHFIYAKDGVVESINLQPARGVIVFGGDLVCSPLPVRRERGRMKVI